MMPPPRLHLKTEPTALKKWAASIFRLFQQNWPLSDIGEDLHLNLAQAN